MQPKNKTDEVPVHSQRVPVSKGLHSIANWGSWRCCSEFVWRPLETALNSVLWLPFEINTNPFIHSHAESKCTKFQTNPRHTKCFTRKCCMHTYSNITGAREIFRSDLRKMGKIHSREVAEERAPPWIGYNKNGICRCRCESKTKKCQWHMCCTGVQYISTRLSNVSNFRNSRGNIFGREMEEWGTGERKRRRWEMGREQGARPCIDVYLASVRSLQRTVKKSAWQTCGTIRM